MIIVEHNSSVNFIDKNDLFLGYELSIHCCENPGWFITYKKPTIKTDLNQSENDCLGRSGTDFTDYEFLPKSLTELTESVFVKAIHPTKKAIYVCIFNIQNGYYNHTYLFAEGVQGVQQSFIDTNGDSAKRQALFEMRSASDDRKYTTYAPWPLSSVKKKNGSI